MAIIMIQARTNSTRLKGKISEDIGGRPLIRHVIDTCRSTGMLCVVVVPVKDPIIKQLKEWKVPYFEGSEDDVLARFYHCAVTYSAKAVIRVTADCPLLDLPYILYLARMEGQVHYAEVRGIDGQDVELISMDALEFAHREAQTKEDREHVTTFIRGHESLRPQAIHTIPFFAEKMSVDTKEDLKRVREIYANRHPVN